MKHIKTHKLFEDVENNTMQNDPAFGTGKINSILNYLSEDKLKESIKEFEDILMLVYAFKDNGFEVDFETVYGSRVHISYDDYHKKTTRWIEFINGFPKYYELTLHFTFNKFDVNLFSYVIAGEYDDFLQKIDSLDWKHKKTNMSLYPPSSNLSKDKMYISIELKKSNLKTRKVSFSSIT